MQEGSSQKSEQEYTLKDYRLGKTIGEGTFGKVKVATHMPTNQKVAVKILQKSKIADQSDIQRITRQICILKRLHHPNIAQLYEIIQTPTDIHLIMEYAPGGELFEHIVKTKRLPEKEAVKYMQQIMAGLEYIHRSGVVHRDLKPENLLLDENRDIKIVDFGLSNQYAVGERLKTACGSPCYAAPEMIAGKRYDSLGVDVWSCGIILFAMLCGFLPFEDANTSKLYKKILAGTYDLPNFLSSDSKDLLKGILTVQPENRFRIEQIRASRWYNQTGKHYTAKGISAGKDAIPVNENIVLILQGKGFESSRIREDIRHNRHNAVTAFYYHLKKQVEKDAPSRNINSKISINISRNNSPLIYRPEVKKIPGPVVVVAREASEGKDRSFNASQIVNSLVEANRDKLKKQSQAVPVPRTQLFHRVQQFKLFPKKKPSIDYTQAFNAPFHSSSKNKNEKAEQLLEFSPHRPSTPTTERPPVRFVHRESPSPQPFRPSPVTDRVVVGHQFSESNNQSFREVSPTSECKRSFISEGKGEGSRAGCLFDDISKKRQELSDELRLISSKIDHSIDELKKQNTSMSNSTTLTNGNKESVKKGEMEKARARIKTEGIPSSNITFSFAPSTPTHQSPTRPTESLFKGSGIKRISVPMSKPKPTSNAPSEVVQNPPNTHSGLFNAECLFNQDIRGLIMRIQLFLRRESMSYWLSDPYTIKIGEQQILIESWQGMSGYYVVLFNEPTSWSAKLITFLK